MSALYVQIRRGNDWLKLTTVPIHGKAHAIDADREYARAYGEACRQVNGWRSYFPDEPLRIAEETSFGKFREARP